MVQVRYASSRAAICTATGSGRGAPLLEVWAPATGFVSRSSYLPREGAALGVLEYHWRMGALEVVARTVAGLRELEPQAIPELVADL